LVSQTQLFQSTTIQLQPTAETLARTTADGLQNTAISNNTDAITAEATTRADAIQQKRRTTADGLQNTAISTNASAITAADFS
jgi:hypothetical protein